MLGIALLVLLPHLLTHAVSLGHAVLHAWLDRRHPDDLPRSAGDWAERKLAELGLDVVIVEGEDDAFNERARKIELQQATYRKADPACWAVAAHEVGHARWYLRSPRLGAILSRARRLRGHNFGLTGLLLANFLLRARIIDDAALVVAWLMLSALALVLVDEALASGTALRLLFSEPELPRRARTAVVIDLVAAGLTYAAAGVGEICLLANFARLRDVLESAHPWTPALVGTARVVVVIATILIALGPAMDLYFVVRRPKVERDRDFFIILIARLVASLAVPVLLILVCNRPLGAGYSLCVVLAGVPAAPAFGLVLIPITMALRELNRLIRRVAARWFRGEPFPVGAGLSHEERLRRLDRAVAAESRAPRRVVHAWLNLLTLPLVVRVWLLLAGY